jgi:hypothetical protein
MGFEKEKQISKETLTEDLNSLFSKVVNESLEKLDSYMWTYNPSNKTFSCMEMLETRLPYEIDDFIIRGVGYTVKAKNIDPESDLMEMFFDITVTILDEERETASWEVKKLLEALRERRKNVYYGWNKKAVNAMERNNLNNISGKTLVYSVSKDKLISKPMRCFNISMDGFEWMEQVKFVPVVWEKEDDLEAVIELINGVKVKYTRDEAIEFADVYMEFI